MNGSDDILDELIGSNAAQSAAQVVASHKRVPIYRLHFPERAEVRNEAYHWARALFTGGQFHDARPQPVEHANRLVLQHPGGQRVRSYFASGCLDYRDLHRAYVASASTSVETLGGADAIVREFAARYALLPPSSEGMLRPLQLQFIRSSGRNLQGLRADVTGVQTLILYERLMHGIAWIGPGSAITAIIDQSDVVGIERNWRHTIPGSVGTVNTSTVEEVLTMFMDRLRTYRGDQPFQPGALRLERMEFGYFQAEKRTFQRFLQPAYQIFYRNTTLTPAFLVEIFPAHKEAIETPGPERALAMAKMRSWRTSP